MVKKKEMKQDFKTIFFTILIAFAIILFWRGVWQLTDLYLFPTNYELSNWISLFAGIIILVLTKNLIKKLI